MKNNLRNKKAFTLFELMIVISIMALLMISLYAPYNYYSNKAKVKLARTQISKTIYEAKNMAIYGLTDSNSNRSVGVYLSNSDSNKNSLKIYSYPFDFIGLKNDFNVTDIKLIKTIKLEPGVWISKIGGENEAILYFNSISGTGSYYYYNPLQTEFLNNEIEIKFGFKGDTGNLSSKVVFYKETQIVDY